MVALLLAPIVLLAGIATGIAYFRLSQAPVSLNFMIDPIRNGISAELPGLDAEVEDVLFALKPTGGFEFRLKNMRLVQEEDSALVATAPQAAIELSTIALLTGRLVPAAVELIEPQVALQYSSDGGLVLKLATNPESGRHERAAGAPSSAGQTAPRAPRAGGGGPTPATAADFSQRIDLARVLSQATARARRGEGASSYLREVGLRDAIVSFNYEGRQSLWQVPLASIDLDHRSRRSIISGSARILSRRGPWSISFLTEDSEKTHTLNMRVSFRDLVPSVLSEALPQLDVLKALDMPVGGDAKLRMSTSGEIVSGRLELELAPGHIRLAGIDDASFPVNAGLFALNYEAASKRLTIKPSKLRWGSSDVTLTGVLQGVNKSGNTEWAYDVRAIEGVLAAPEIGLEPTPLDAWQMSGIYLSPEGKLKVDTLKLAAGGGEINLRGEIDTSDSLNSANFEGQLSPMPLLALKALWPQLMAPGARRWVGRHVSDASIASGSIRFQSGHYYKQETGNSSGNDQSRLSLAIEGKDAVAVPLLGKPAVKAPRVLVRLENSALEVAIPDAAILVAPGTEIPLKQGRVTAVDVDSDRPLGEIAFRTSGSVGPVLRLLEHPSLNFKGLRELPVDRISGDVTGEMTIKLPLIDEVQLHEIDLVGTMQVKDGSVKGLVGKHNVQGAGITFNVTTRAVNASGEMLLAGILTKLNWQRIFDAPAERQPPMRLNATLDNSDRALLGLDPGGSIRGDVPVDVTVTGWSSGEPNVHVRADLTPAEIVFQSLAWRKPPGQAAFLECDVEESFNYPTLLSNFKLEGDNIDISGWVGMDDNGRALAFEFPTFAPDFVTRLKVSGKRDKSKVWRVSARGSTYDGRSFFRSLFSVGQLGEPRKKVEEKSESIDLSANIETVIGYSEVSLHNLSLKLSKRAGKISALSARGSLDGGKPLAAEYREDEKTGRRLLSDSTDAGQAFKLIGFYPKINNGRVRLEVNLDGRGAAEKTGTLWVENFTVLGDPVVSEVISSAGPGASAPTKKKRNTQVTQQVFQFDRMRVPFSVGHGQFVLEDSYVRGPLIGATVRGKVDYGSKIVNLGGTYVPLQGLNNALGGVPIVGDLLSGPRGEGIFGITFAVTGPMAGPQVIVNPLSLVAPGIFREIFQLTPQAPRVLPRSDNTQNKSGSRRTRASSAPPTGPAIRPR